MSDHAKKPQTDAQQKTAALNRWDNEGGAIKTNRPKRPRDPAQLAKLVEAAESGKPAKRGPYKKPSAEISN